MKDNFCNSGICTAWWRTSTNKTQKAMKTLKHSLKTKIKWVHRWRDLIEWTMKFQSKKEEKICKNQANNLLIRMNDQVFVWISFYCTQLSPDFMNKINVIINKSPITMNLTSKSKLKQSSLASLKKDKYDSLTLGKKNPNLPSSDKKSDGLKIMKA